MARTKLVRIATVALAAGGLALAGCGVSGGGGTGTRAGGTEPQSVEAGSFDGARGASFLRQAASATAEVTSMRSHMTVSNRGGPIDLEMRAEGEFDLSSGRGRFTMSLADVGDIEVVVDGDAVYMKVPMMGGGGKPWAKVDVSEVGTSQTAAMDPGAVLKMIEGTGAEITTVGKEEVRGVPTTHVETTLDLRKLVAEAAGDDKAALEKQLEAMGGQALPAVPTHVWVDDDGYVRKMTMEMDLGALSGDSDIDAVITTTVELYDFNEPVDVSVPDPSQVGDFGSDLFGGGD